MTKKSLTHNDSSTAYLDHDHRERKNIRFLAICSRVIRDLWCRPLCSLIIEETSLGIRVLGHRGETKIRDPCPARVVHKDVRLYMCQTNRNADQ